MADDAKKTPTENQSQQPHKGQQDIQKKNPFPQGHEDEQDDQQKGDKRRAS